MASYIILTKKKRLRCNRDDYTLEEYKESYWSDPIGRNKVGRQVPAGWYSMDKYFPNVSLAVKYILNNHLYMGTEHFSLSDYLKAQEELYLEVKNNLDTVDHLKLYKSSSEED